MRLFRRPFLVALVATNFVPLAAQEPGLQRTPGTRGAVHLLPLDSPGTASLWFAIPSFDRGEADLQLAVRFLEQAVAEELPLLFGDGLRTERLVSEHGSFFGFTGTVEEVAAVDGWLSGLADGVVATMSDDRFAVLRDRTLLRADDEARVLPGLRLRSLAGGRRGLSVAELRDFGSWTKERAAGALGEMFRGPGLQTLVCGDVAGTGLEAVAGPEFPRSRSTWTDLAAPVSEQPFPRLEAVYAQASFEVPAALLERPFLLDVAVEVLRLGVLQSFEWRGSEVRAELRAVDRPFLTDRVTLGRRGLDGQPKAELFEELRSFAGGFADSTGPFLSFETARRAVELRFAPTPETLRAGFALHLHGRLQFEALLLGRTGLPPVPEASEVSEDRVREALRVLLGDPESLLALVPSGR